MAKRLMKVDTSSCLMFVTYDAEEKVAMVLEDSNDCDITNISVSEVEDDSSWDRHENVENIEEWLGCYNDSDRTEILEECEF